MKNTLKLLVLATILTLMAPAIAHAQVQTVRTALTAALSATGSTITVTATTGFTASTSSVGQYVYIDKEAAKVSAVSTTTPYTVTLIERGTMGTTRAPHLNNATVWFGPRDAFLQGPSVPQGQCTRASETYLPKIHVVTGLVYDCLLQPSAATGVTTQATTHQWSAINLAPVTYVRPFKLLRPEENTYTLLASDEIVGINTNVAVTITVPSLTGMWGKQYYLQMMITGTQSVTVTMPPGQTVNGAGTAIWGGSITGASAQNNQNFQAFIMTYDGGTRWFGANVP